MGGYSKQASAGLIALIALRRAQAEYDRRKALSGTRASDGDEAPAKTEPAKAKRKRGWFG